MGLRSAGYLREMGAVPLLTRKGEVDIAKRIERGQLRTLKALSRSPVVIRQILAIGEDLKHGVRSIREVVFVYEEAMPLSGGSGLPLDDALLASTTVFDIFPGRSVCGLPEIQP